MLHKYFIGILMNNACLISVYLCVFIMQLKRELKVQLEEQEGFFRTKLNYLADKIHKYYDDRLKQEIEYFEKQLQDQHDKDNSIVLKLKRRINQLLKTDPVDRLTITEFMNHNWVKVSQDFMLGLDRRLGLLV